LAVFDLSDGSALEIDQGLDAVQGLWDGKRAVAVVAAPGLAQPRDSHVADLRSLHEISFKLSLCVSVDELCREAVRLGREMLGFDRIGAWLCEAGKPTSLQGGWGTDESGELRDERGWKHERKKGELPDSFYQGRLPVICKEDTIRRADDDRVLGAAARLIAPLWDGRSFIGEIGADDFLRHQGFSPEKQEVFVTFSRIVAHLISLKRVEDELKQLASIDSLTGAVNRRTALIILEKHLGQCRRSGSPLTICLADLDGLKIVNDAFGHAAGDKYICSASAALVSAVRASDTVGRIGGDEFLIVFPDCRGDLVAGIMERVNADLADGQFCSGYVPRLSWGVASASDLDKGRRADMLDLQRSIDMLLELADQRMYENKRAQGSSRRSAPNAAQMAL
jgi:diguanylate cyclase (GGDEF)-like protein